ncbi:MAG: hypothetical protein HKO68_20655 [Desulfobacterales bacterium]|nr:hypothetical protein [Desulfobacterales bacterium]
MNETRSRSWISILSYTVICIVALGLIYFVAEAFFPKTSSELIPRKDDLSARFMSFFRWNDNYRDGQKEVLAKPLKEKIMLLIDQDTKIGKSKMVYRGLDGNANFRIDVAILELDPQAYYRYRLLINDAQKGFRLVGQNFRLISARKSAIQLWHLKK